MQRDPDDISPLLEGQVRPCSQQWHMPTDAALGDSSLLAVVVPSPRALSTEGSDLVMY